MELLSPRDEMDWDAKVCRSTSDVKSPLGSWSPFDPTYTKAKMMLILKMCETFQTHKCLLCHATTIKI